MALSTLDRSEAITREALRAIIWSPLPDKLEIDGRTVTFSDDTPKPNGDFRIIRARWGASSAGLRVHASSDGSEVPAAKRGDKGHIFGLGVSSPSRSRRFLWTHFEWAVRDALRSNNSSVHLEVKHIYTGRLIDGDESVNQTQMTLSRAVAARSGLGGENTLELGNYDLVGRAWDRDDILEKILKLGLIKAHFMDRGSGQFITGAPLFPISEAWAASGSTAASPETAAPQDPAAPQEPAASQDPAASTPPATPPRTRPSYANIDPSEFSVELDLPSDVLYRCIAALNSGKHLLLLGPPGTGKSTLAAALARHVHALGGCDKPPLLATASADWSTYDTIGGWAQRSDQTLDFREGVVTRALREGSWLILDEVNRADIDKCFGELFTVLAGTGTVTTAYTRRVDEREDPITIGPDQEPYNFGPWFRLIATMNMRDKASLFRLSYAFMRRFAVVFVPGLDDERLRGLAERHGQRLGVSDDTWQLAFRCLSRKQGLAAQLELGPSLLIDVLGYAAARGVSATRGVGEALGALVFPQLEGAEAAVAKEARERLDGLFDADHNMRDDLRRELAGYFPHLRP